MKTTYKLSLAVLLAAGMLLAQGDKTPAAEPEYFRLDFVVKEVQNGKAVNSRNYSMVVLADAKERSSIRTGTKTPVPTVPGQPQMYQYVDVGVNIDSRSVQRQRDRLIMNVNAELSTVAPVEDKTAPAVPPIRQNRWNAPVIIPIGKPTTLFSSDDLATTRTLQLEVTATPVK